MKIIALLPVKNEAWVLPSYLSSISKIADKIIALDDSSTDDSKRILDEAGATVLLYDSSKEEIVNMGKRRQTLLEAGRKAGGTHFIWLDADETFSSSFVEQARKEILQLTPGQKLSLRWVHAWKDTTHYINDSQSAFGYIWKDFIVCDDSSQSFEEKFLSEARTPGSHDLLREIPEATGIVIHWQFSNWEAVQMKQALYRCTELVEGTRSARRINNTYSRTLDTKNLQIKILPTSWIEKIAIPSSEISSSHHREKIFCYFREYGLVFFEPLQIWHIPELRELFIKEVGREPVAKTFPKWLVSLNKIKNKIKNG